MKKPNDYDEVQGYGEFTPLSVGGHICKIMKVEEVKSKNGKDMIAISLDIAEGKQKDYFANLWKYDKRENKKWGCVVYQLVYDNEGKTNKGFKTFNTSVKESNEGFEIQWGDNYANCFKNRLIGGIFGREQYQKTDGNLAWSVKCQSFRSVETIKKGVEPPTDKLLDVKSNTVTNNSNNSNFYTVENTVDEDNLPF